MANLRIVYNNVLAAYTSLTASTTAGSLAVTNLLTDIKSEVWRSTSTTASITVTWTALQQLAFVGLPFCNLTPTATVRVRLYSDTAGTTLVLDTGTVLAAQVQMFGYADFGMPAFGVNNFGYGGGNYAEVWFTPTNARRLVVDIVDSSNTSGYIEAARLVCGNYWSPTYNVSYESIRLSMAEMTKHERSDAGNLHSDRGPLYKTLTFNLQYMPEADRDYLWRITRGNGMTRAVYVSLSPESSNVKEEKMFQVYGKLSRQSEIQYQFASQFAGQLQIEEI